MLDVDNRIAGLQHALTDNLSRSLACAVAKHRVLKWDSRLAEAEVDAVIQDLSAAAQGAEQPTSQQADVNVQELLLVANTMLPWSRLHADYELESTVLFVKQLYESDAGVHSTGELPEVA